MADDPFNFEHGTIRIGDGPEIPLAGPLKITYTSGTRPDSGYIRAGDLHGEWTFPVEGDIDALLQRANDLVDQYMDSARERALGIDPARVIDGETVTATWKEIEGG